MIKEATLAGSFSPAVLAIGAAVATGAIVVGVIAGPGTIACVERGDFGQCMSETFLGAEPEMVAGVGTPAEEPGAASDTATPQTAAEDPEIAETEPEPAAPAVAPSFELARVEPDGSAVMAGSATPGGDIQIFANDELIGEETAERSGDWAFVTREPLPAGGVELRVFDLTSEQFAETSVVVVVQDDRTSEPLVVASAPGEASEILQGVTATDTAEPAPAETAQVEDSAEQAEEPDPVAQPEAPAAEAGTPEPAAEETAPAETTAAEPAQTDTPAQEAEAQVSAEPAQAEPVTEAVAEADPPVDPTPEPEDNADAAPEPEVAGDSVASGETSAPEQPGGDEAAAETGGAELSTEEAAVADTDQDTQPGSEAVQAPSEATAEPVPTAPAEEMAVASADPAQPAAAPEEPAMTIVPPTIEAVEIDGDRNFFAGSGTEDLTVRLYVDNSPVGTTTVADGRWLIEAINVLTGENHRIRVDMLNPDGSVAGRAEVNFVVDLPGAVESQPQEEPVAVAEAPEPEAAEPAAAPEDEAVADGQAAPEPTADAAPLAPEPAAGADSEQAPEAAGGAEAEESVPTLVGVSEGDRVVSGQAIIRRGDNLWTIARRVYGEGVRYTQIYDANTDQIRNPDLIYPGQVFTLPGTDMQIGGEAET